jgi:methyl-accepting chemotaxis protein
MKSIRLVVVLLLMLAIPVVSLASENKGTRDEARALVEKAAAYIKANGKEKAFVEFSKPKGKFVNKDLYIFAIGFNGVFLAHGANQSLVGNNQLQSKDENVRLVTIRLIETAQRGGGWYDYKWPNPLTGELQRKSSYIYKVDDSVFIGCGIYR